MRIKQSIKLRVHPWDSDKACDEKLSLNGRGSARLLLPISNRDVRLGSSLLPLVGFPFIERGRWVQAYSLPQNSTPGESLQSKSDMLSVSDQTVEQTELLPRPRRGKAKANDIEAVRSRDKWLFWQLLRYFELSHPDGNLEGFEKGYGSVVRRSWETVRKEWIKADSDEPEVSLIVRLASNFALVDALNLITRSPRRILERYRADTPIGRIQELDSACIVNYAHRPGRNVLEKAGAKQRLQSVLRREDVDTLENRVTFWVLQRISFMAKEWLSRNGAFSKSERFNKVKKLSLKIDDWVSRPTFLDVENLSELPSEPNYPLQFEPRYKLVWNAYLSIRREEQVFEDAWTWQRVLWGESGRQIFHGFLTEMWPEMVVSTPVYRMDGLNGQWLMPFRAPGPFEGPIYLYDAMDISTSGWSELWKKSDAFPDFDRIGGCGCDQVLWFGNHGIAIWYPMLDPELITLDKMVYQARKSLDRVVSDREQWVGLVIAADLSIKDQSPQVEQVGLGTSICVGISIPMDAHRFFEDIEAGIEMALEAVGGGGLV